MSINEGCEAEKITSLVKHHVPKAKLSQQHEAELTFTLPFESMDTFPGQITLSWKVRCLFLTCSETWSGSNFESSWYKSLKSTQKSHIYSQFRRYILLYVHSFLWLSFSSTVTAPRQMLRKLLQLICDSASTVDQKQVLMNLSFIGLFSELDCQPKLGIINYGVSMTTLEDVFLRLEAEAEVDQAGECVTKAARSIVTLKTIPNYSIIKRNDSVCLCDVFRLQCV